jgi:metallo-beta-lactamase family protein
VSTALTFLGGAGGTVTGSKHLLENKDGASEIRLLGVTVEVNATIMVSDAYSAHADQGEILRWLRGFKRPPGITYVVHGEAEAAEALREEIASRLGWNSAVAQDGQRVTL